MEQNFSNLKLYVVKQGDSIESVSKKFACTKEEIYRLNPLAKRRIYPGQPLNIYRSPHPTVSSEVREKKVQNNEVLQDLIKQAFYIKEAILSTFYYEDALPIYKDIVHQVTDRILENLTKEKKKEIQPYVDKLLNKMIDFADLIKRKAADEIGSYEKELLSLYEDLEKANHANWTEEEKEGLKKSFSRIMSLYQLYTLKVYGKEFKDAAIIFSDLLAESQYIYSILLESL